MENVWKFVSWDVPELEKLSTTKAYQCMEQLNNHINLTREQKDSFDFSEGSFVKWYGWLFDFRPYCNRYLVHYKHYGWEEVWHFDKTAIRKNPADKILEIVQIPKHT